MDIPELIKDKWNSILQVALVIVLLISKFTIPPQFNNDLLQSQVDFISFANFLVAGLLLLIIVPAQFFKQKINTWFWWTGAVVFIIAGIFFYFQYNSNVNTRSVFDDDAKSRVVIGNTLSSPAKTTVDLYAQKHGGATLSPAELIQGLGGPEKVWPKNEIEANANKIVINYLITILCLSAFIICGIQAVYIASQKETPA